MFTSREEKAGFGQLLTAKIKSLHIREGGRHARLTYLGADAAGDYRTEDPCVINLFRDYCKRRGEWYFDRGDIFPVEIVFVASNGWQRSFQAYPIRPEANGPGYMSALNAFAEDIARQYARTATRLRLDAGNIRKIEFYPHDSGGYFVRRPIFTPADISAALKAMEALDGRAFTFGEAGTDLEIAFQHASGKKTAFRLRPPIYKNVRDASRAAKPLLPQPFWAWLYGVPQQ